MRACRRRGGLYLKVYFLLVSLTNAAFCDAHRCLIELDTAIESGVPIVALNCIGSGYDFVEAIDYMLHLETSLEALNPDALAVLSKNNVDPIRLAHKLHSVLPNIIAIPLNSSASDNATKATMADLVKAVKNATPITVEDKGFEAWLASRKVKESLALEQALNSGTIRGTQRGRMLQKIERADEMAAELQESRAMVAKLMAKMEKQEVKIERYEEKLGY